MPPDCDFSRPDDVVRHFAQDMAHWEFEATRMIYENAEEMSEHASPWPQLRVGMQEVFDRYCTLKDRPYGRQGNFTPRATGAVAVHILEITEETARRCAITAEQSFQHNPRNLDLLTTETFRYTLLKQGGQWRIDSRQKHSAGKWLKYFL